MRKLSRVERLTAGAAAVGLLLAFAGTSPAMAAGGSRSRSCSTPKSVTGFSDQTGTGYHHFYASGVTYDTIQPAWQRGQFHSFTSLSSSSWLVYAPIVYSYGATCL